MAEMISVREAAVRWNITERRVATLCKNGRIAGAKKQGNRWLIPADTQKPADQRLKTGAFRKTERAPKLPLPIGVSNYCLASSEYYYIDKTMMIKDFIDERPMVTLFTRPRRFGKSLLIDNRSASRIDQYCIRLHQGNQIPAYQPFGVRQQRTMYAYHVAVRHQTAQIRLLDAGRQLIRSF